MIGLVLATYAFAQVKTPAPLGDSTRDALKKLEAAMKNEIASKPEETDEEAYERDRARRASASSLAANIESMIDRGDSANPEYTLKELSNSFTSGEVLKQIENVRMAIKNDREARQKGYVAEVSAALKEAADAVQNAKKPEDLDQTLNNLSKFRYDGGVENFGAEARAIQNKAQSTVHFVQQWQNYIAARKNGNTEMARNSLQNLSSGEYFDLMPRSRILAELEKYPTAGQERNRDKEKSEGVTGEQVDAIVAKAKTLDSVSAVVKELRELRLKSPTNTPYSNIDPLNATLNALTAIENTYRDFKAGLPTRMEIPGGSSSDAISAQVAPLRAQLFLLVLPRHLNVPADLAPKPGEDAQAYLERVVQDARKRGDGPLLVRVRNAQRNLTGNTSGESDSTAINLVTAGQNQEAAGQYMLAVASYQNALRIGSDAVPAKMIGERLAGIKSAHPEEYDQGMERFLNPPRSDRDRAGNFSPGPNERHHVEKNLKIPAASPAATVSASVSPTATSSPTPSPGPRKP